MKGRLSKRVISGLLSVVVPLTSIQVGNLVVNADQTDSAYADELLIHPYSELNDTDDESPSSDITDNVQNPMLNKWSNAGIFDVYASGSEFLVNLALNSSGSANSTLTLTGTIYNDRYKYLFNIVGGKTASTTNQDEQVGTINATINGKAFSKTANGGTYAFRGWSLDPYVRGADAGMGIQVTSGIGEKSWGYEANHSTDETRINGGYEIYNDTTLYAIWEPNTYNIIYRGNDNTGLLDESFTNSYVSTSVDNGVTVEDYSKKMSKSSDKNPDADANNPETQVCYWDNRSGSPYTKGGSKAEYDHYNSYQNVYDRYYTINLNLGDSLSDDYNKDPEAGEVDGDTSTNKEPAYILDPTADGGMTSDSKAKVLKEQWTFANWAVGHYHKNGNEDYKTCTQSHYDMGETFQCPNDDVYNPFGLSHNASTTFYATWDKGYITLPDVVRKGYKFIGWFDKSQSVGSVNTGANMIGKAGDKVSLGWESTVDKSQSQHSNLEWTSDGVRPNTTTIYAWWNEMPKIHDIYEGTFFEGQQISKLDILKLIGVSDYEDDYKTKVAEELAKIPTIIECKVEVPIKIKPDKVAGNPNFVIENDKVLEIRYKDENGDWIDKTGGLFAEEKEAILVAAGQTKCLVDVKELEYTQDKDGVTFNIAGDGTRKPEPYKITGVDLKNDGLDTRTDNIGYFNVTYTVTDNGILNNSSRIELSPITLEYTRKCQILYNNIPKIHLENTIFTFANDNGLVPSTVDAYFDKFVNVDDLQDSVSNAPWWYKAKKSDSLPSGKYYEYTQKELKDNLRVSAIKDITINTGYMYNLTIDQKADVNNIVNRIENMVQTVDTDMSGYVNPLEELYKLKNGSDFEKELFKNITGYKIVYDTKDQWGKYASNTVIDDSTNQQGTGEDEHGVRPTPFNEPNCPDINPQADESDRTLQIINIDEDSDVDLFDSNLFRSIRYISTKYLGTLGTSYWSEYGRAYLDGTLKKEKYDGAPSYNGTTVDGVDITVNDYSDKLNKYESNPNSGSN